MYLATYMKSATVYPSRQLWAICEPSCSSTHAQFSTQQQFMKHFAEVKQIKMRFLSWPSQICSNCEIQTLDNLLSFIFSLKMVQPFWTIRKTDFYQSCCFFWKKCNNKCVNSMSHWQRRLKLFALYIVDNIKPVFQNNFLHRYTRHQSNSIFQSSTHEKEGLYNLQLSVLLIGIPHWHQKDTRVPWESQTRNIQSIIDWLLSFFLSDWSWLSYIIYWERNNQILLNSFQLKQSCLNDLKRQSQSPHQDFLQSLAPETTYGEHNT